MTSLETKSGSIEKETSCFWDVVIPLPTYPFPKEKVTGNREPLDGVVEQIAGLPNRSHPSGLWIDTRLKDLATALMVIHGDSRTIMTLSRPIRSWMKESFADLMQKDILDFLHSYGTGNQPLNFIKENVTNTQGSYSLLSEMLVVREQIRGYGWRKVALISDQESEKRARKIIDNWKNSGEAQPHIEIIPMENILTNKNYLPEKMYPHLGSIIERLHKSPFWGFWTIREYVARNSIGLTEWLAEKTR